MKVITSVTVRIVAEQGKNGKAPKYKYISPGERELPEDVAKDLLAKGHAKTPAEVAEEAKADKGPTVTKTSGKGSDKK